MSIEIEKGIPIPTSSRGRREGKSIFPFSEMAIGDSVFHGLYSSGQSAASKYAKLNPGWNYTTRKENGGVRIWRIKGNEEA